MTFWAQKTSQGQKLTNLKKKKRNFGETKQAEAELKKKKQFFWAKNWGKI